MKEGQAFRFAGCLESPGTLTRHWKALLEGSSCDVAHSHLEAWRGQKGQEFLLVLLVLILAWRYLRRHTIIHVSSLSS